MNRSAKDALLLVLIVVILASIIFTTTSTRPPLAAQSGNAQTPMAAPLHVGDFVWDDLDRDGRQDEGEPGLERIPVQLWDSSMTQLVDETLTDALGAYLIIAPEPGDYRIRVILASFGDQFSPKYSPEADDVLDSDINADVMEADFGFSDVFTLNSNGFGTTGIDAGIIRPAAPSRPPILLGDFVWNDLNENGLQDEDEPGLVGITVQLWNGDQSELVYETSTDERGEYTLVTYDPGFYRVRVLEPDGAVFSLKDVSLNSNDGIDSDINAVVPEGNYGFSDVISLQPNVTCVVNIDAGLISVPDTPTPTPTLALSQTLTPTRTLLPTVTPDGTDPCQQAQLTGTPGGLIVTDTPEPAETRETPSASDTSASTPTWTPTPLPSATASLTATATLSMTPTDTPTDVVIQQVTDTDTPSPTASETASATTTLTPSSTPTRTPTPINLGNFVWDDLDHDGRQDAGEPGLSGVTVQLWNSTKTLLIDSAVTSASGIYTLVAPLPGNYRMRVLLPAAGDEFSPKDQAGGDDTEDSDINPAGINFGFTDIISIANNVISISSLDAGVIVFRTPTPTRTPTPINLGNFVWDDLDQDGRQDGGEPGLSGITVQLWNSVKTLLIDSAVTNASGNYTVVAPIPGDYRIRVILPGVGDQFSPKDQAGGDDTEDSDINPSGINAGFSDIITIANNVISISNRDAGILIFRTPTPTRTPTPINLGNFVWDDLDFDGQQDAGEPGLEGITVQLWNNAKTLLIDQTMTSASGSYTLVAPLPGDYRIRALPEGEYDNFSPKDQAGGDDLEDSDINPDGIHVGFTDTISIASNVISISNLDIGIITPLVLEPLPTAIIIPLFATSTPLMNPLPPAPPPTPIIQRPDPNLCGGFRLTSPLDGLPNGMATFYWDPVNAQGVTYRVVVMDEGRSVLASFEAGAGTSVSGDVSQGAIGGLFQLVVQVNALLNGRVVCTEERLILREAGAAPPPNVGVPTNQPPLPTNPPPRVTNTPCPAGRPC